MASLVLIKPDAVRNHKIGKIISRLEFHFQVRSMQIKIGRFHELTKHYADHHGEDFYPGLIRAMMEGPLYAVYVIGDVDLIRKSMMDYRAENRAFCNGPYNLVHASDSQAAADREIKLWFPNAN